MRAGWVWAPKAQQVTLLVFERKHRVRTTLAARPGGFWGNDQALAPGTLYGFCIDGGPILPDPRSQFQPRGLPGPSEVIDHASFAWSALRYSPPPLSSAVFYELHVGTFSRAGTYQGVRQRLDHLAELGITHLELMPLHQFPGRHGWGYDGVQLAAPFHHYGRPEELKRLVDECHGRGIAVVLDVVYNHVGPDQNTLGRFGPYLCRDARTPWGHGYNLDGRYRQEVRRFILDNARQWLEDYRFDGLRLDAVHSMKDASRPHLLDDLADQTRELSRRLGRQLWLFAEAEARRPRLTQARQRGGHGLHAQWDDDLHYAMVGFLTNERVGHYGRTHGLSKLALALEGRPVRRSKGPQRGLRVAPERLITCIQNHDRVGNRPDGRRFRALAGCELDRLAQLLMFSSPLRPLLFMGQEWGAETPFYYFADHQRAALARAVRRGRAREMKGFGWKTACPVAPDSLQAFRRSHLAWSELDAPEHQQQLRFCTRLIALRRRFDELQRPARVTLDEAARTLRMRRPRTLVLANLGGQLHRFRVEAGSRVLIASGDGATLRDRRAELPPLTACLLERPQPGQGPRGGTKRRKRS